MFSTSKGPYLNSIASVQVFMHACFCMVWILSMSLFLFDLNLVNIYNFMLLRKSYSMNSCNKWCCKRVVQVRLTASEAKLRDRHSWSCSALKSSGRSWREADRSGSRIPHGSEAKHRWRFFFDSFPGLEGVGVAEGKHNHSSTLPGTQTVSAYDCPPGQGFAGMTPQSCADALHEHKSPALSVDVALLWWPGSSS